MLRLVSNAWRAFRKGDRFVKLSALFWAAGYLARKQYFKAMLKTLTQAFFLVSILGCLPYMAKLPTLGTVQAQRVYDPVLRMNVWNDYDHSFLILLFGTVGVGLLIVSTVAYLRNLCEAYHVQQSAAEGRPLPGMRALLGRAVGSRFHVTLLSGPVAGVICVTVVPLIVMILVAFTNYDRSHLAPTNLFTWVGLDNFRQLAGLGGSSFGYALLRVLGWTLVWAVLSTFSCYFGGVLLALLIGGKATRGKAFWRVCFMVAMAVPQFVSLLLMRNLFADVGVVNTLLKNLGVTDWLHRMGLIPTAGYVPFLTHPDFARPMILLINLWVGVPYQLLIATGILMNIPPELHEAARIDGASPMQAFRHVTLPYLLFITGPSLVSALIANVNNFNVIWLLTRDVYTTADQRLASAGATEVDLLVTWLYRLTQDQSNYKMASVIGLMVFIVCSALTLTAFMRLNRGAREEEFQ